MKFDLQVTIPRNRPISGYCHPEIDRFPSNETRKLAESFKKTLKTHKKIGNILLFTIARYCYPEIDTKKPLFHKYLRENENIFEIILGFDSRA